MSRSSNCREIVTSTCEVQLKTDVSPLTTQPAAGAVTLTRDPSALSWLWQAPHVSLWVQRETGETNVSFQTGWRFGYTEVGFAEQEEDVAAQQPSSFSASRDDRAPAAPGYMLRTCASTPLAEQSQGLRAFGQPAAWA